MPSKSRRTRRQGKQISLSVGNTKQEVVATFATLSTPVKPKRRHPMQGPSYFENRKSTIIKQGKPQPPSAIPITIDESTNQREEVRCREGKIEEVTSPKAKVKQPFPLIGRPNTRLVTSKSLKAQATLLQEKTKEI